MFPNNLFEPRKSIFSEISELSAENILSENTASKMKNRKDKLFQKIMSIRKNLFLKYNNNVQIENKKNKISSFKKILNLISSNDDKINLINYLFINDIQKVFELITKYQKQNPKNLNLIIDYDKLSKSNYLLDIIETQNDILKIIIQNKENALYLINKINLMSNGILPYDRNYIMICGYFYISNENIGQILKQELNHNKIIELIIKNETEISYIYLFYIYSYIYYFDNEQIGKCDNILDSLILILINKKNCDNDNLLWEIYDLLTFFSKIPKFFSKFYDNYEYLFVKREFYEKDIITIEKLKIVLNIFKNINNERIKLFLQKDNGSLLNLILFSLRILSNINSNNKNIYNNEIKLKLFLESVNILLIITTYKDLTYMLLENKKCIFNLFEAFNNLISIRKNEDNLLLNEICNTIYIIINNIILSEHQIFIYKFKEKQLHLKIKDKIDYYGLNNYINERVFLNLINIVIALYENDKKKNFKKESFKNDLDNNKFYDSILTITLKFNNNENIHNKCINFIAHYYQK